MSEQRRRTEMVSVRFHPREMPLVRERARRLGLSMSGYLRQEALVTAAGFKGFWWEVLRNRE